MMRLEWVGKIKFIGILELIIGVVDLLEGSVMILGGSLLLFLSGYYSPDINAIRRNNNTVKAE